MTNKMNFLFRNPLCSSQKTQKMKLKFDFLAFDSWFLSCGLLVRALFLAFGSLFRLEMSPAQCFCGSDQICIGNDRITLEGIISFPRSKHFGHDHQLEIVIVSSKSVVNDIIDGQWGAKNVADLGGRSGDRSLDSNQRTS
jgi:hypothetical protein